MWSGCFGGQCAVQSSASGMCECAAEVLEACDSLGRVAANDDFVCEEKKGVCRFFFRFNSLPPYLLRSQGNIKIDPTTLTTKLFR